MGKRGPPGEEYDVRIEHAKIDGVDASEVALDGAILVPKFRDFLCHLLSIAPEGWIVQIRKQIMIREEILILMRRSQRFGLAMTLTMSRWIMEMGSIHTRRNGLGILLMMYEMRETTEMKPIIVMMTVQRIG
jgi:hypothetical protein